LESLCELYFMRGDLIKAGVLILLLVIFQLIGAYQSSFPNLQPIAALIFCGFATLNSRLSWVTIVAWLVAYPVVTKLNGDYNILTSIFWVQFFSFGLIAFLAKTVFKSHSESESGELFRLMGGGLCGAILFYVITNSAMPTWHFFRNSMVANLTFIFFYWVSLQSFESKKVVLKNEVSAN